MKQKRLTAWLMALAGAIALLALFWTFSPSSVAEAAIPSPNAPQHTEAITKAIAYLRTQQLADGSLPGYDGTADAFTTIKGVIGLAAAGAPPSALTSAEGKTMLDYLAAQAITYTHDLSGTLFPGRAGMLAVAVVAADGDPTAFGGIDLIAELSATYHAETGAYSTTAQMGWSSGAAGNLNQAWAILGLSAVQQSIPLSATDFLLDRQLADGGWGFGTTGDVDTTALVVQALLASGNLTPTHPALRQAEQFFRARQDANGSWGYTWGGTYTPSADSTAAAIQALVALGYTPASYAWATPNGGDPHAALAAMQGADGAFSFNALGTAHALPGLTEAPLPIFGAAQRARWALSHVAAEQQSDGGILGWTGSSDPGTTADAVLAFAAAGYDPHTVVSPTLSLMDYLSNTAASYAARGPDAAGKLAVAVVAAGDDPHAFGGVNLISVITQSYTETGTLGGYGTLTNTWHQALAILGLRAAGEPVPITATRTLSSLQQSDGGWKYDLADAWWNITSPDNTAIAVEALIAAGVPRESGVITRALAFLEARRSPEGDWGNPDSTAYAIQALLAAGEPLTSTRWVVNEQWPIARLEHFQKPEGSFYLPSAMGKWDNTFAARQAIPALMGQAFPFTMTAPAPWSSVPTGADSDRFVAGPARYDLAHRALILPYGSDLNHNGFITVTWRPQGVLTWSEPLTLDHATPWLITTTYPISAGGAEIRVHYADPDGVQGEAEQTIILHGLFLPLVMRGQ